MAEQMAGAGAITVRPMFGEYGVYCDGKVVAFICDNTLFLKPLPALLAVLDEPEMAPCYPGSKDYVVVTDELDDPERLAFLVRTVADAAPEPKPKKPRKTKAQ
jgi:TfoX/Sxy family transcriptional regulator of competence genes